MNSSKRVQPFQAIQPIELICPFCNGYVNAGTHNIVGEGPFDGVIHSEPYCEKFAKLDPVEFIRAVRIALQGN